MDETIVLSKKKLKDWCDRYMDTHTDWTGTRVETVNECESVEEFVDKLYDYLSNNE